MGNYVDIFSRATQVTLITMGLWGSCGSAKADDFRMLEVSSLDGNVECHSQSDWFVTTVSGPCEDFDPPKSISVGQGFSADGSDRTINVIVARRAEKDFSGYGLELKKGDWTCVAAETEADLPSEEDGNKRWIFIRKCAPVTPASP